MYMAYYAPHMITHFPSDAAFMLTPSQLSHTQDTHSLSHSDTTRDDSILYSYSQRRGSMTFIP
jgi:hypothetical protein